MLTFGVNRSSSEVTSLRQNLPARSLWEARHTSSGPRRFYSPPALPVGINEVSVTVLSQIYGYFLQPDQYRRTKKRDRD